MAAPYEPDEAQGLTLRDYLGVLWRRKWIVLLVTVVAGGAAYAFSARQTPMYEAAATLIYERSLDVANPLTGQSYTNVEERQLELQSVADVIASPDMQERAEEELAREFPAGASLDYTVTSATTESGGSSSDRTNTVFISASSSSPKLATAAANAYAVAYVAWRKERVKAQIKRAQYAISSELERYSGAAQQSADYLVLQQRLRDLQILHATATGNFRVLTPAEPPTAPYEPQPMRSAVLGLAVGLFAGIGLAFLLEQFDNSIRTAEQVSHVLRQPVLARIPRMGRRELDDGVLATVTQPESNAAEAFRLLRTNLEFMTVDADVRSLVVSSCVQSEGKSVTAANLAVALALAGKKVVIVDADLRRPRLHRYFDLPNDDGVSTVVTGRARLADVIQPYQVVPLDGEDGGAAAGGAGAAAAGASAFHSWVQSSDAKSRLYVVTSGPIPPNPGELVASRRFGELMDTLEGEADIVIVDSPAMLPVGDTAALAAKVDGLVFLADTGVVKRQQLEAAAEQIGRLPCKTLGVVVAREHHRGKTYYGGQYYYRYEEDGRNGKGGKGQKARRKARAAEPQA